MNVKFGFDKKNRVKKSFIHFIKINNYLLNLYNIKNY